MKKVINSLNDFDLKDLFFDNQNNALNYLGWEHLSEFYNLSEDFMRENQNALNWLSISCNRENLSLEFILEFKANLNLDIMLQYHNITPEIYNKVING